MGNQLQSLSMSADPSCRPEMKEHNNYAWGSVFVELWQKLEEMEIGNKKRDI